MVVLHGMLGSSRNWMSAGADLAQDWHVHALDQRNHGKSPHAEPMNYDALVGDVLAWMDARAIDQIDLMGHSMGGKVSMVLAIQHPERVRRLIVVDIAPKDYLSHGHRAEFAAMHELRLNEIRSRGEAELRMESRVADWGMRKFITTNLERDEANGGWRWIINLPVITAALPDLERNPLAPTDTFDGPTLFIAGGKSRYIAPADHAVIRRHFPSVQIETIANSGHNPHMEARTDLVQCVRAHAG
ncbi:alpha/beta fold hydrolase [Synoicihabitans lomoniglobus]|uniref:Alpha/beta fold hydrolase n=1 Tax=Synoicihabitans lomoniglobus TaxID=2909285 RepID=A0AAF0CRN7_9BACT|nr:alpha/beta fold hydrolase [Opitutaceae bacterium LMO-M01]WED66805.1 alpha/beta fold hydrolase [Opitutaceae bacterium LMO-M01]